MSFVSQVVRVVEVSGASTPSESQSARRSRSSLPRESRDPEDYSTDLLIADADAISILRICKTL
jgi:hypothetical protein